MNRGRVACSSPNAGWRVPLRPPSLRWLVLSLLLSTLLPVIGWPDATRAAGVTEVPASLESAIDSHRKTLEQASLAEAALKSARADLDVASTQDKDASRLAADAQALRDKARPLPGPAPVPPDVETQREQFRSWTARLPGETSAVALERVLAQEQQAVNELRGRIETTATDLAGLISRPGTDAKMIAVLQDKVQAAERAGAPIPGEATALTEARRLRSAAEQRRLLAEIAFHETQQATAQARQLQLERQLTELRLELAQREPRLPWLTEQIAARERKRLDDQAQRLQALAATAPEDRAGEALRENAALAVELRDGGVALQRERQALVELERRRDLIATALRDTEARLRIGGKSDAIGLWMWQQRLALPSFPTLRAELVDMQDALARLRVRLFSITQQRHVLGRVAGQSLADDVQATTDEPAPADDTQTLATKDELLDDLAQELQRRIAVLEQSSGAVAQSLEQGERLQGTFDRELLWMRSHAAAGFAWLRQAPADIASSLKQTSLSATARQVRSSVLRNPVSSVLGVGAIAILVVFGMRARPLLAELATQVRHPFHDSLALTLRAGAWTVLPALPWAAGLWLLSELLATAPDPSVTALAMALRFLAGMTLILLVVRAAVAPGGLGEVHFGWSERRLRAFRRAWPVAVALLIPGALATIVSLYGGSVRGVDSLGRSAVVLMCLGLAWLAHRFLRDLSSNQATFRPPLRRERAAAFIMPALFLGVAALALLGYVYTAMVVFGALLATAGVILTVMLIDGLLRRWLLLRERQLAYRRMREAPLAEPDVADTEAGEKPSPAQDAELALVKIGEQARSIVRVIRYVLLAAGFLWAWSDVVPALLRLDEIVLWHASVVDAEGRTVAQAVSLMKLLVALLVLVVTITLTRNLPGLVEMLLSASSYITASARYTVVTLLRYALTIAGATVAVGMLGLRWTQLQWLAAALTVGLGFGLQEIFANFVSGLILLVERPFRVGDTITVGQLTGTVKRIQTRATTMVDYDNRETIIPNKNFITGQIVNWTLSDTVTRVVVPVGVAYGSDIARVRELLLRAAGEHPLVLADPPPRAWLLGLGESAINLDLRVYVGGIGDRLQVSNDLIERIARLLAENGIEVPFRQMDVHVRDVPPATPGAAPSA